MSERTKDSRPAPLTEADVRRIVKDEIAKSKKDEPSTWQHDADHGATQERLSQQRARDEASGVNVHED